MKNGLCVSLEAPIAAHIRRMKMLARVRLRQLKGSNLLAFPFQAESARLVLMELTAMSRTVIVTLSKMATPDTGPIPQNTASALSTATERAMSIAFVTTAM